MKQSRPVHPRDSDRPDKFETERRRRRREYIIKKATKTYADEVATRNLQRQMSLNEEE